MFFVITGCDSLLFTPRLIGGALVFYALMVYDVSVRVCCTALLCGVVIVYNDS